MKKKTKGNKIKLKPKKIKTNKKNKKKKNIWEIIAIIFMLGLISITIVAVTFIIIVIIGAPEFSEEQLYAKESSILYYKDGTEIARIGTENRELVSYDDLPEVLIDAILATEDSRFMQHKGIDLPRFLKASFGQLLGNSSAGGASTLPMQIVKLKFTDKTSTGIKGIIRKFTDIYMSVFKIEKKYTKEQIIEFYVNIPYLGGSAHGIEQASQSYFNKPISEVSLAEAAMLAGLFQAPNAFDPFHNPEKTESRRNTVLNLMRRHHYITDEEYELAKAISVESMLARTSSEMDENQGMIDTAVAEVRRRTGQDPFSVSMKVYTTFEKEKQAVVNKVNDGEAYKWPNEDIQTGIAVIDVKTGGISAVGAGRNKQRALGLNYATGINRHPGSTAKPLFAFGPAVEHLNWGTGQMIIDDVHTYSNGVSIRNWDYGYKGIMTIKTALGLSRNIPALQAFQAVSQKQINEFVTGIGLTPQYEDGNFISEAHSIGGYNGTNPVQLAGAYATFARGGIYIEPHSVTKVEFVKTDEVYTVTPEKRTAMRDSTAFIMNNILRYSVTSGFVAGGSVSGTDICGKTGTSTFSASEKRQLGVPSSAIPDSWQVVYSPDYTIASWFGYEKTTPEHYLTSGVAGTARSRVSRYLSTNIMEKNSRFKAPSSVVAAEIELETNPVQLASEFTPSNLRRTEYFRKGANPHEVSPRFSKLENPSNLEVSYQNGRSLLTWDPVSTPLAIDTDYLTEYFENGYTKWAEKYFNQRLNYNAQNIGNVGYQVYIDTGSGLRDLGWTSNNSFTHNEILSSNAKFVIKTSYSIFKDNMSSGITKTVSAPSTPQPSSSVELTTSPCISLDYYKNLKSQGKTYLRVLDNGLNITNISKITDICYENASEINCSFMNSDSQYIIKPKIEYNDRLITHSVVLNIRNNC